MPHTTELPYTPHRAQHSPVEQLRSPLEDVRGHYGTPYRSIDILERLQARGAITPEMRSAGQRFHDTFRRAALDPLKAASLERIPHGTKPTLSDSAEASRLKLSAMMQFLGGHGSLAGSIAWDVLGEEQSLFGWATEHGLDVREARGMLRVTLDALHRRATGPARPHGDRR